MTTTPNQPDREREAREMLAAHGCVEGFSAPLEPGYVAVVDPDAVIRAMLAFRDADRAGEGDRDITGVLGLVRLYCKTPQQAEHLKNAIRAALSTPATPLLDDETVERCAAIADVYAKTVKPSVTAFRGLAAAIRALKGSAK